MDALEWFFLKHLKGTKLSVEEEKWTRKHRLYKMYNDLHSFGKIYVEIRLFHEEIGGYLVASTYLTAYQNIK